MLTDDVILDLAETRTLNMIDIAETVVFMQESNDAAAIEDASDGFDVHGTLDPEAALREGVRRDVFLVLSAKFPTLTLRRFPEVRKHPAVAEQLETIADQQDRDDCLAEIFQELADEAVSDVLSERGVFDGIDVVSKEGTTSAMELIQHYSSLLRERSGISTSSRPTPTRAVSAFERKEIESLLREAELESVDVAAIAARIDRTDDVSDDAEEDAILSTDQRHGYELSRLFDVLTECCGGRMCLLSLLRMRDDPELSRCLMMMCDEARDECFSYVFYRIAERAVLQNPRFASLRRNDDVELIASEYVLLLMERHGIA